LIERSEQAAAGRRRQGVVPDSATSVVVPSGFRTTTNWLGAAPPSPCAGSVATPPTMVPADLGASCEAFTFKDGNLVRP
jgi:hypothetical protein